MKGAARLLIERRAPVPDGLSAIVEAITSIAHFDRQDAVLENTGWMEANSLIDSPKTVTIYGTRGSGKTTCLAAVAAELNSNDGFIVLPILRPELMGSHDTILSSMVARLLDYYRTQSDLRDRDASQSDLSPEAAVLAADILVSSNPVTDLVFAQELPPRQAAHDALGIAQARANRTANLSRLVRLVLDVHSSSSSSPSLLILPIDDADLILDDLEQVFRDLRQLSAIPSVLPIVCVDLDHIRDLAKGGADERRRELFRSLEKSLPGARRFRLPQVSRSSRLPFRPVGDDRSLRDRFIALEHGLEGLFDIRPGILAFLEHEQSSSFHQFALCSLPATNRRLEQLCFIMDDLSDRLARHQELRGPLAEEPGYSAAAGELVQPVMRFLDSLIASQDRAAVSVVSVMAVASSRPSTRAPLEIDLTGLATAYRLAGEGGWQPVSTERNSRLEFLRIAKPVLSYSETERMVPEADEVSAAVLLLDEVVLHSGLFEVSKRYRDFEIDDSDWSFLQKVSFEGLRTDDIFFMLPNASGGLKVMLSQLVWNRIFVRDDRSDVSGEDLLARMCDGVLRFLCRRSAGPIGIGDWDPQLISAGHLPQLLDELANEFLLLIDQEDRWSTDYCEWYLVGLPMSMHESVVSHEIIDLFLAQRTAAIARAPKGDAFESDLSDALGRRLRAAKSSSVASAAWIAGYARLVRGVAYEHLDHIKEQEREWSNLRDRTSRARVVMSESVEFSGTADPKRFSLYEDEKARRQFNEIRAVLARLRSDVLGPKTWT